MTRPPKYPNEVEVKGDASGLSVYAYGTHDGRCLYAGSTRNYLQRKRGHRQQEWWQYASFVLVRNCQTIEEMERVELNWIHNLAPLFNKKHVPQPYETYSGFAFSVCLHCDWDTTIRGIPARMTIEEQRKALDMTAIPPTPAMMARWAV